MERLMIYLTLGLVLTTLDVNVFDWGFWAVLALFWASELLTRKETETLAMAQGIAHFLNMTVEEQNNIKKLHQKTLQEEKK